MSRAAVLHHLVEVIATEGTAGLTVRRVAASAGVAIGTVQHYFPTKNAMLLAAVDVIGETAVQAYTGITTTSDPEAELIALVRLIIPGDSNSRVARVWLAFAAHSIVDTEISARYQALWASTHRVLAARMSAAEPAAGAEAVKAAATELLALADGLAVSVLAEPGRISADQARTIAVRRCRELLSSLR